MPTDKPIDVVERTRQLQIDRKREANDWWKALSSEAQRAAYAAWLADNPGDFRSGWGFELASISRNSMEAFWEHHNRNNKQ